MGALDLAATFPRLPLIRLRLLAALAVQRLAELALHVVLGMLGSRRRVGHADLLCSDEYLLSLGRRSTGIAQTPPEATGETMTRGQQAGRGPGAVKINVKGRQGCQPLGWLW